MWWVTEFGRRIDIASKRVFMILWVSWITMNWFCKSQLIWSWLSQLTWAGWVFILLIISLLNIKYKIIFLLPKLIQISITPIFWYFNPSKAILKSSPVITRIIIHSNIRCTLMSIEIMLHFSRWSKFAPILTVTMSIWFVILMSSPLTTTHLSIICRICTFIVACWPSTRICIIFILWSVCHIFFF